MNNTVSQQALETLRNLLIVMGFLLLAITLRSCSVEADSSVRRAGEEFHVGALSLDRGEGLTLNTSE